ncbi:tRNA (adenosine(37)-N6)-dimethylallyltransferase MiaA [Novosphingobium sp. MW5]|nr:tRNA (adenosine(37)-N6)-dimethylallyltransferase MiaA [Novosphingobium sp. MW5]
MSTEDSPEGPGRPPLALIAGPTASGKSDLAVRLAQALEKRGRRGVVINADSAQVYADLCILSARPLDEEMKGVEHSLYGAWDGATACSAADWAQAAKAEVAAAHAAGAVPILVGGTGLYIRTLIEGIAPVPEIDPQIRAEVRSLPVAQAYAALQVEDPERAARLDAGDATRVARALEVARSTGRPLAHWQQQLSGGIGDQVALYPAILLPDRAWLYERCDRRFHSMLQRGAIAEVEALLARALPGDLPVMRAIGVPEIADFLRGISSLADAETRGSQSTRNYVKRQMTWLRNQPSEDWPRVESEDFNIEDIFASLLRD